MGLSFSVTKGSNKATCKICGQRIKGDEIQITAYGYQTQGSIHLNCAIAGGAKALNRAFSLFNTDKIDEVEQHEN